MSRCINHIQFAARLIFILCCNIIGLLHTDTCKWHKINNVIYILNPLKLTACIEVEYGAEVKLVVNDVLQSWFI